MDILGEAGEGRTGAALRRAASRRRYLRGAAVHRVEEPAAVVHLVLDGHVCVQTTTYQGKLAILGVVGPGGLVGDDALLVEESGTRPPRAPWTRCPPSR